jgi:hypothetical protein
VATVLLTVTTAGSAQAIGTQLGIGRDPLEVLPEDKARIVGELKGGGRKVAMVGRRHQRCAGTGGRGCGHCDVHRHRSGRCMPPA